jgi:hypothetical protein
LNIIHNSTNMLTIFMMPSYMNISCRFVFDSHVTINTFILWSVTHYNLDGFQGCNQWWELMWSLKDNLDLKYSWSSFACKRFGNCMRFHVNFRNLFIFVVSHILSIINHSNLNCMLRFLVMLQFLECLNWISHRLQASLSNSVS